LLVRKKDLQQVQKLKYKSLTAIIFLITSLWCFGQSGDFADDDQQDIQELENQLQEFKQSQQDVIDDMNPEQMKIQEQIQQAISQGDQAKVQELTRKLTKNMKMGNSGQMKKMVDASLSTFRSLSENQLRSHLIAKTQGNVFGQVFAEFPKLLEYIIQVLRDPIAVPQFFSILEKKTKLMIFFGINVFLWLVAFVIKRAHKAKRAGFFTHFKRGLFFAVIRLGLFIGFFHVEITPFVSIASRTFA